MRSILAFYEIDRDYGGPEEGGWYYDSGTFVRAIAIHFDDESAVRAMRRANRLLERLQRHRPKVDSCLYAGGRHRAYTFTGLPPERFPATRPGYE
ncbi:hypothetical protein [Sphingomonas solaris]|uniref:Uncharacterized protein n=1 Tax=Alterirhizorhabdus solaris TaxID=2529389 RepID=A0A558RC71_9SPHN|nr:hypothetical protein [Sphingomonas solaris]TVV76976.1 hypothetical protein FOY91_02750 [Sphingomonas solaris]